ncbi:orotidine-5'-phosphate decarboxylase [Periweissella beninensis]|uniref:Orotidine 5'-phosphate decarboxylase n=1 Tax=Periweissella beninensis TaxID=504936 RepID=A0ABT0VHR5_9LACO|nr:orotidine-5'-phosphate decarboxylase [Periweissella beninensis]MBM7544056.1 orotidine-5'-phosphate decarboxylase [Periweissella beninensis]MCM2437387.1 orotidine-5'-phosphate decarboxylase [Periweissella beninensis]MCT4396387.1 orotidine-5'-phosphate decarboxylase [Periweissella beninensis]
MQPVFIALDFKDITKTREFLVQFSGLQRPYVKIGIELFYHGGPQFVKELRDTGYRIFLDVKMFDIPTTVKKAAFQIGQLGIDVVTVHALGGPQMIQAAFEGLAAGAKMTGVPRPKLLAITQLTSFDEMTMQTVQATNESLITSVLRLAKMAKESSADGVIASAQEAQQIHQLLGNDFLVITPGIRLASDISNDQQRVMTPAMAKLATSNGLVVGRSITHSDNPKQVYQEINKEFN